MKGPLASCEVVLSTDLGRHGEVVLSTDLGRQGEVVLSTYLGRQSKVEVVLGKDPQPCLQHTHAGEGVAAATGTLVTDLNNVYSSMDPVV